MQQRQLHIEDLRVVAERTLLVLQSQTKIVNERLRTASAGKDLLIVGLSDNLGNLRSSQSVHSGDAILSIVQHGQGVGVLALHVLRLQLGVLTVGDVQVQVHVGLLLAQLQHAHHTLKVVVVSDNQDDRQGLTHALLHRDLLHSADVIHNVSSHSSETATSSHSNHVISVLLQDGAGSIHVLLSGVLLHRVRSLDVGSQSLHVAQAGDQMSPGVHLASDLDEEADSVSAVVSHTHGVVLPEAGSRDVDVSDRTDEVGELHRLGEQGVHGNLHVHEVTISMDHADGATTSIDGDPADQLVDDVEGDGNHGDVLEVEGVEVEADEEEHHHHLVEVEEHLPNVAADPRDGSQHHRTPQRSGLEQEIRSLHETELVPVVGATLVVPVDVPELSEARDTTGDLHANEAEHDVDHSHPEGEGSVQTVSRDDGGLEVRNA